jgi:purine-binding chemotaxis protein CheW
MGEYLTFSLDGERYAFSIKDVDSVVESSGFTRLPQDEPCMRGIMNLRGAVVPVVDLRRKFGLPARDEEAVESVIVLSVGEDGESRLVGAVADEVHEVLLLDEARIEPPPALSSAGRSCADFVAGIGRNEDGFIVILDAAFARVGRAEAAATTA